MKNVKFLLSAALVFLASAALAQDFSGPQYAKWGATPEEREQNILNSGFDAYTSKPINAQKLNTQIIDLLKNRLIFI